MYHDSPGESGSDTWSESDFAAALHGAKAGYGAAFADLYRWLAPRVTNFVAARGAADPEAVTNEVFLRVFERIDRFSGPSASFRTWIFILARNLMDANEDGGRPQQADGPGSDAFGRPFGALGSGQRDVVLLRMIAGLTAEQVAIVVDQPLDAVAALQRQALRQLQRDLVRDVASR